MGDGPYDSEDPVAERLGRSHGRIDFGSLRVPIPARAQLQVEKGNGDLLRAVHVLVPSGRVSLSALAAPRTNPLWRGLAGEIGDSLSNDGARVRTEWGEWGREVEAASNGAISRFIGVDGPRWMLYGVATGPADGAEDLVVVLRDMMRGTVVFRGPDPLPVKTVLPLRLPEGLEERVEEAREVSREDSRARPARSDRAGPAPDRSDDVRPPVARPPAARSNGAPAAPYDTGPRPAVPPAREPMPPRRPLGAPAGPPARGAGRPPVPPVQPGRGVPPAHPEHGVRPAAARLPATPAIGSLGRPSAPNGLPPVPAAPARSSGSAVEATWSLANPVVNAAEVDQQPAWASLNAAPSFWPHEHYRPEEPACSGSPGADLSYGAGSPGADLPFGGAGGSYRAADPFPTVAPPPADLDVGRSDRAETGPGYPVPDGLGLPGSAAGEPTPLERAILAEMSFGAGPSAFDDRPAAGYGPGGGNPDCRSGDGRPADGRPGDGRHGDRDYGWSGSDSDLLSSTDGLHAVLLNDSAATRGWAAGAERRGRRRREE